MDKQNFLAPEYNGKFPISANTFEFMQNQTEFVSSLGSIFGQNVLLKFATSTRDGLIVFQGELLPLRYASGVTINYYNLVEETEDIIAQGVLYKDARKIRYVRGEAASVGKSVSANTVVDLTGNKTTNIANQFLPKGAIIMWSGSWDDIPTGYKLCNGRGTVNGVTIPDLRGKFIVGGDSSDSDFDVSGKTGGSKTHTLTVQEIPSHSHNVSVPKRGAKNIRGGDDDHWHLDNDNSISTESTGGGQPFKHLPPYYVLAFLIKVI